MISHTSDSPTRSYAYLNKVILFQKVGDVDGLVLNSVGIARPTGSEHLPAYFFAVDMGAVYSESANLYECADNTVVTKSFLENDSRSVVFDGS